MAASDAIIDLGSLQERITQIAARDLGLATEQLAPDRDLVEDLKMDSLDVLSLATSLEEEFGVKFPDKKFGSFKTLAGIASEISHLLREGAHNKS